MLINLDSISANKEEYIYDVCICGAGPAGITVARTLAKKGMRVALLEGGGLEYSQQSQDLYKGKTTESLGLKYYDNITNCRLRYLGGTSNHWTGMCGFFEEADLKREMNGLPAWPISKEEMFKHSDEAKEILDLPKDVFVEKNKWQGDHFSNYISGLSPPTRFKNKYLKELKESKLIDLYVNANLTDIKLDNHMEQVKYLEISNNSITKFKFSSKQYVLAMGAVETARILLSSNKQVALGVGNENDMVGRCFMEHLNVDYGGFVIDNSKLWHSSSISIKPTSVFANTANIGSGVISFHSNAEVKDYGRTAILKKALRSMVCKSESATSFAKKIKDFDCDGDGVISSMIEQSPNKNSRLTLDTEKDRFGLPKIILDWQYNEFDLNTIRTIGVEAAKEMAKLGFARVKLSDYILDKKINLENVGGHCHQMGTTRMSTNPKYGVVDENSKVHGMKNLFISSSAVYPTGGFCNPTFTLTMLALRLGNHLSQKTS
jgi:choline dehydrogenase-like flavoprotein